MGLNLNFSMYNHGNMKTIIRLVLILMMFLTSIVAQANEVCSLSEKQNDVSVIKNINYQFNSFDYCEHQEIIAQNVKSQELFVKTENDNQDFNFNNLNNKYCSASKQFTLMLSYMYSKSYFAQGNSLLWRTFLTEINPNAPNSQYV